MVTQMVTDLELIARKQANILVSFQLTEENDCKKVAQYFDIDPELLKSLKDYHFIIKDLKTGEQTIDRLST
jgi:hypothetical protein